MKLSSLHHCLSLCGVRSRVNRLTNVGMNDVTDREIKFISSFVICIDGDHLLKVSTQVVT